MLGDLQGVVQSLMDAGLAFVLRSDSSSSHRASPSPSRAHTPTQEQPPPSRTGAAVQGAALLVRSPSGCGFSNAEASCSEGASGGNPRSQFVPLRLSGHDIDRSAPVSSSLGSFGGSLGSSFNAFPPSLDLRGSLDRDRDLLGRGCCEVCVGLAESPAQRGAVEGGGCHTPDQIQSVPEGPSLYPTEVQGDTAPSSPITAAAPCTSPPPSAVPPLSPLPPPLRHSNEEDQSPRVRISRQGFDGRLAQ